MINLFLTIFYSFTSSSHLNNFFFFFIDFRLQNISKSSPCPLQSLSVQLPMGDYSDELFSILEHQVDSLSNIFTDPGGSVIGSPSKFNLI